MSVIPDILIDLFIAALFGILSYLLFSGYFHKPVADSTDTTSSNKNQEGEPHQKNISSGEIFHERGDNSSTTDNNYNKNSRVNFSLFNRITECRKKYCYDRYVYPCCYQYFINNGQILKA